jgi:hypothetical protein
MDSPQALSIVYDVAAEELRVSEPLNLHFASPPPYDCAYLIAATAHVTGISIVIKLQGDTDEETALRACGRALANAVRFSASSPGEVLSVLGQGFTSLIQVYCEIAQPPLVHRQIVSVAAAIASACEQLDDWPRRITHAPWP